MVSKHTAEPWSWMLAEHESRLQGGDGTVSIFRVPKVVNGRIRPISPADRERIVACVNACAGLDPAGIPDALAALHKTADWLLGNGTHVKGCVHGADNMSCSCGVTEASNAACAAIAKLEGRTG